MKTTLLYIFSFAFFTLGSPLAHAATAKPKKEPSCADLLQQTLQEDRAITTLITVFYDATNERRPEGPADYFKSQGMPGFAHGKDYYMRRISEGVYEIAFLAPPRLADENVRNTFNYFLKQFESARYATVADAVAAVDKLKGVTVPQRFQYEGIRFDKREQKLWVKATVNHPDAQFKLQIQSRYDTLPPRFETKLVLMGKAGLTAEQVRKGEFEVDLSEIPADLHPANIQVNNLIEFQLLPSKDP